jgi:hypothetical protein
VSNLPESCRSQPRFNSETRKWLRAALRSHLARAPAKRTQVERAVGCTNLAEAEGLDELLLEIP